MSKRTGGIEVVKTRKKKKKNKGVRQPWGQGDGGGRVTGNLVVLVTRRCIGFVG